MSGMIHTPPPPQYAHVALPLSPAPQHSAIYTYRVPAQLELSIGQLVWVPVQRKQMQGIVVALDHTAPAQYHGQVRDVLGLVEPEVAILPSSIALAQWLSQTAQTSLYDALSLFLPPGVRQSAVTTWRASAAGMQTDLGDLPLLERALLYTLRTHGPTAVRELHTLLRSTPAAIRKAGVALLERGLLETGSDVSQPRARPSIERLVQLAITPAQLDTALASLSRAPKQQAIVRWLAVQPDQTASLKTLHAAVGTSQPSLQALHQRALIRMHEREQQRDPLADLVVAPDQPPPLTPLQARVWQPIQAALEQAIAVQQQDPQSLEPPEPPRPFLLHGVTGSGKTEIYLRAIARALRLGRQALVLVPEIALTTQLVRRFVARLPGKVAVLHSHLSIGERYDTWRKLRCGEARLLIGSRSAVFAPLPDLSLIILDEEHEPSFKQDNQPRYHAREVALQLAHRTGSVVLLGSATPALESYTAAKQGHYTLLELHERVGGEIGPNGLPLARPLPLPPVRLVDMRQELQQGNSSILSRALHAALHTTLERGEQAILFLNRRGAASFVLCRDCGHVLRCPRCNTSLTVHYTSDEDNQTHATLICHACNQRSPQPAICPQCLSPRIKGFGVGTQRVEQHIQQTFPTARVVRWDSDTVRGKHAHHTMLEQFLRHEADVLIGTQMIAKGLDLPRVALVGVIAGDMGLHLPDFRSAERTFQLLTQVAGRAGRRSAGAQVIIQTYDPTHYALRAAQEHDYHSFYVQEIAFRRQLRYPPYSRLIRLVYAHSSRTACEREVAELAGRVQASMRHFPPASLSIIGPAPAFIERQRGRWRWHLLLRLLPPLEPHAVLAQLGPLRGWQVDIDPLQLL